MSIVRDDCDDGRTRLDRMIDEFLKAQSRRLAKANAVKGDDHVVEPQRNTRAPGGGRRVDDYTFFTRE